MFGEGPSLTPEEVSTYRIGFFLGILVIMGVLEKIFPRRVRLLSQTVRWFNNLGLVVLNSVLMRLIIPVSLIWFADYLVNNQWGLFNIVDVPFWVGFVATIIIMDLAIYFQHRLFHMVPLFWRLHRLHHADLDYDVTTGLRFHPIEILLSMAIKFALVAVLGAPGLAVVVFEIILNGMAVFNHANAKLPLGLDRVLRLIFVTPDVHRVHHSTIPAEFNMNFGFNLSLWDRLFGTYKAQPDQGHEGMTIGLNQFRGPTEHHLHNMLSQPFRKSK
jgi:sterol desaturase/sphingolipid hydroxylase (fatty acid hydroxylase superfamily)